MERDTSKVQQRQQNHIADTNAETIQAKSIAPPPMRLHSGTNLQKKEEKSETSETAQDTAELQSKATTDIVPPPILPSQPIQPKYHIGIAPPQTAAQNIQAKSIAPPPFRVFSGTNLQKKEENKNEDQATTQEATVSQPQSDVPSLLQRKAEGSTMPVATQSEIRTNEPIIQRDGPTGGEATRSTADYAATVAMREAFLRDAYQAIDRAIGQEARLMVQKGMNVDDVARWAVEARNTAKTSIRQRGLPIVRWLAERRNMGQYGNPVGPSYEQLRSGYTRPSTGQSVAPRTIEQILESAARSNAGVNRWAGRLRVAGRIMIAIDIGIGIYNVAQAPEVDRPRVLLEEAGRIGGAVAGGWAGAEAGAWAGGVVGAWFGGVGAVPGAAIGGLLGGIGGAIGGGWLGQQGGRLLANELYPVAQTGLEGGYRR